ncbi:MAG: aryl-sulfate sulfotransferase [Flavobacteriales bacterium]|nr:aryl-sulfate sulfotransferase [Flavobacteriales bacterium]
MRRIIFLFVFIPNFLFTQNQTLGLFQYDSGSIDGYTLFSPNEYTYLIDNCGKLVHSWQSSYMPGNSAYLLENGDLLRTCRTTSSVFSGGGIGGRVERYDWDDNLLWSYDFSDNNYHQHHDIELMPNGNILVLCWERKLLIDAILAGRDPSTLVDNELWPTYIIEAEPQGSNGINIVWEWYFWDHLVQDFDPSKLNYGTVENHPELLDINFYGNNGKKDWLHCNSIDYNADLDQIVISSRKLSELYIIDHSTTTSQAASHNGGIYGQGGDILYRWGNPIAYNNGTSADQQLFGQHDIQWIPNDLEDGGKLIVFNNGMNRGYSSVDVILPPIDVNNNYYLSNNVFGPSFPDWTYTAPNPTDFYASYISGVQRLPNGNTLICDGAHGIFFEIDSTENIVWNYVNPISSNGPLVQGNSIPLNNNGNGTINSTFRCQRYLPSFPGFIGRNLTPGNYLEINPIVTSCNMITDIHQTSSHNKNRELLYISDLLGKKTKLKYNSILLYQYDDGYVEKRLIKK